jgi:small subunit ribosomal protein S2
VAVAVVCVLEVVEVEEDERETSAVAAGAGRLRRQTSVEGFVIQEPGERIATGSLGELAGHASDVRGDAAVESIPGFGLGVAVEDAPEHEELGRHLAGREAEAFSLAGEVVSESRRVVFSSESGNERGKAAELSQAPEPLEGRRHALLEGTLHALDGEVPRRCSYDPGHGRVKEYRADRLECSGFLPQPGGCIRVAVPGMPGSTRIHRQHNFKPRRISLSVVTMRELLEAGVHFGHQTRRWNPKMRRYIFTERGGIYIIDLQQTLELVEQAASFARNIAERGGSVLFVGTKKQAQDAVYDEATRVGMPYVNHRWLGGLLTNWRTISERLERLHELRRLRDEGQLELLPPKERMSMLSELEKLDTNLGGVVDMKRLPDAMFVLDLRKEQLAIREARRLGMPVIALVDTNCDPDDADYVIPGNDDAIRSCSLIVRVIAGAIEAGKSKVTADEMAARAAKQEAAEQEPAAPGPEGEGETEAEPEAAAEPETAGEPEAAAEPEAQLEAEVPEEVPAE